ncbi:MAG: hypothetical protein ACR2OA_13850, partial [Rubripirellula sp.]
MSSACVLWFPWPHLRSGARQINQLDGFEYGTARERALKNPECRDEQHSGRSHLRRYRNKLVEQIRYLTRKNNLVIRFSYVVVSRFSGGTFPEELCQGL